jgi:glycosyltransferase involved in cell wall biosynthesis
MCEVMQKALTVSVIIPVYNEESHLRACLDALAMQTIAPDEVIVVDNNSTDGTAAIARSYSFVKLISEPQQGLYFSRNTGMAAATGTVLGRIDADTVVDTHWVARLHELFADTAVQAVTGPVGYYDVPLPRQNRLMAHMFFKGAMALSYTFMFGCNMAIRRKTWQLIVKDLCNEPFLLEDMDIVTHLDQRGIVPVYDKRLSVLASARRMLDPLPQFVRYITGHSRTLAHHDRRCVGARYAEFWYLVGHIVGRPLFLGFDPVTRRMSLKRLFTAPSTRPDPMMGDEIESARLDYVPVEPD